MLSKSSIVFVDSCPIFCDGLAVCLQKLNGIHVTQFRYAELAHHFVREHQKESLLLILGPHVRTRDAFKLCRVAASLGAKILFISTHADDILFQADLAYVGAAACVTHEIASDELLQVLQNMAYGHILFSREILQEAFQPIELSPRELDVLKFIAHGKVDSEIADELELSPATVRNHSQRILERLHVNNRKDAVHRAQHRGII